MKVRSSEELTELQNPALALAVRRERLRLTRLHAHLFSQHNAGASEEPEVGLESFIWAHCLVRSRALQLTADKVLSNQLLPLLHACSEGMRK